jgi:hypothetical protein
VSKEACDFEDLGPFVDSREALDIFEDIDTAVVGQAMADSIAVGLNLADMGRAIAQMVDMVIGLANCYFPEEKLLKLKQNYKNIFSLILMQMNRSIPFIKRKRRRNIA